MGTADLIHNSINILVVLRLLGVRYSALHDLDMTINMTNCTVILRQERVSFRSAQITD